MKLPIILSEDGDIEFLRSVAEEKIIGRFLQVGYI